MVGSGRTYTIDEANALLPEVRAVLLQLAVEQRRLEKAHAELHARLDRDAAADGSEAAQLEARVTEISEGIRSLEAHLNGLGVVLRDVEMGLVDFPGHRDGRRIWLCWRLSDPRVAFWHPTDEGYASRKPW